MNHQPALEKCNNDVLFKFAFEEYEDGILDEQGHKEFREQAKAELERRLRLSGFLNPMTDKCTKPISVGEMFRHPSFEGVKRVGCFFGSHDDGPHEYVIDVTKKPIYVLADGEEYFWTETQKFLQ